MTFTSIIQVKEIIWTGASNHTGYEGRVSDLVADAGADYKNCKWKLKLNGHDRFAERPTTYFTRTQRYQYHSAPNTIDNIAVYSFALKPEEHQPSGTCNFSRIDTAQLVQSHDIETDAKGSGGDIYAVNYNILRIMSGMGGLAYSN